MNLYIFLHNLYVRSTYTFINKLNEMSFVKIQVKQISFEPRTELAKNYINPVNTKRRQVYLKTQFVPRSKHFSSRL